MESAAFQRYALQRLASTERSHLSMAFGVAGTIEDNIAYGRYGRCSRDEVEQAARDANAHGEENRLAKNRVIQ